MKYSNLVGIIAAIVLIVACFIPWAYYPDINKNFTGFFSEGNNYGKPGKVILFFSIIAIAFFIFPKVWAKRANILVAGTIVAYCIKCFILFTSCYSGICPEKKIGIFLILICSILILATAVSPDLKLKSGEK
jgi:hypothetical protein